MSAALAALALAVGLELAVGEPSSRAHPVAWFGRIAQHADRDWPHPRIVGLALALSLPLLAACAVIGAVAVAFELAPFLGIITAGSVLFVSTSLRMLSETARETIAASERDLDAARESLLALAGRDASALSAGEVRSAATESAAENLADGLVAPLLFFALLAPFSLSLAAGAAAWIKAVNTLDSMLGYPSKAHGTASARLDDLAMWLPARLSAVLITLAAGRPIALVRACEWASAPPSPNSGWPMATLAASLDVRLEKPGGYVLNPNAALPTSMDARRGVRIVVCSGALSYLLAGAIVW